MLASHNDYEALLKFAYDFYALIAEDLVGTTAALPGARVGFNFIEVMKKHGINEPDYDFSPT